jgi:hypothetical protein
VSYSKRLKGKSRTVRTKEVEIKYRKPKKKFPPEARMFVLRVLNKKQKNKMEDNDDKETSTDEP